ncbi:MAG: zinc metallopeptidase [Candidatus Mcinerneyibacterium aminivorans]|uniref:Zinc metallopeptidase n=1 Tax=Candidatus Mcinerneyibacterium aminivorans TaxID=2703815 RepID=A0A5D0MEP2_9BACT|nr:MAG: zinc metallopeptidase [Candidatus Mcinerneyibacterium aminivorans]
MFFYDPTFILLIPVIILSFWAQHKVKATFKKYSKEMADKRISSNEVARDILRRSNMNIPIERVKGQLSDHYDPQEKVLRLSDSVYGKNNISAIAVAAHEAGHALQDSKGYMPLKIRNAFAPVANIGSKLAFPLIFIGFLLQAFSLLKIGIIFYAAAVIFSIITLPVEFNASSTALNIIKNNGYLNSNELTGAKKVLNAAAMTYVASTLAALVNLLRFILLARR